MRGNGELAAGTFDRHLTDLIRIADIEADVVSTFALVYFEHKADVIYVGYIGHITLRDMGLLSRLRGIRQDWPTLWSTSKPRHTAMGNRWP